MHLTAMSHGETYAFVHPRGGNLPADVISVVRFLLSDVCRPIVCRPMFAIRILLSDVCCLMIVVRFLSPPLLSGSGNTEGKYTASRKAIFPRYLSEKTCFFAKNPPLQLPVDKLQGRIGGILPRNLIFCKHENVGVPVYPNVETWAPGARQECREPECGVPEC